MTTTTPSPAAASSSARERNHEVWTRASALMFAGRIDEFAALWTDDARYEVAYPVPGFPPVVEGRVALARLFAGLTAVTTDIRTEEFRFHQTDDPDVAFVEERMRADLVGGGRYDNRLAMRVTFRDGRIARVFEYYGYREHEGMLRDLGLIAAT